MTGQPQQQRQGRQAADPDAAGYQVHDVGRDGRGRARLHRRRVAGRGHQAEGDGAEEGDLAAQRLPVGARSQLDADGEEGDEQHEQPGPDQPHDAAPGLGEHAGQGLWVHSGAGTALQHGRLVGHRAQGGGEGDEGEDATAGEDARLPAARRRPVRAPRHKQQSRPADQEDRRRQVQPAGKEPDYFPQSKLTSAPRLNRAAGPGIRRRAGLPRATVIFLVAAGRVTSAP